MKQTEAAAFLPIIQAWAEGKTIQFSATNERWVDCLNSVDMEFSFPPDYYRIKPEPPKPREWWMNTYSDGNPAIHKSKESANRYADPSRIECVHVREVIEESNQ